jgi:hypothetical protein
VNASNPVLPAGADEPMDDLDELILSGVNELWGSVDPMPADLIDQVLFAIDLDSVDIEVLRLAELEVVAARGEELSRLITFDGDRLTIMVRVSPNQDGTTRIDGWLTPAASHAIELRTVAGGSLAEVSDAAGRFVFGAVPAGLAQFVVHPTGSEHTVTTPAISL